MHAHVNGFYIVVHTQPIYSIYSNETHVSEKPSQTEAQIFQIQFRWKMGIGYSILGTECF